MTTNSITSLEESGERPRPKPRRPRYAGKYPRKFADKYKELDPEKYPETVDRVRLSGKTPAGMHVPIMVREIIEVLDPKPPKQEKKKKKQPRPRTKSSAKGGHKIGHSRRAHHDRIPVND